MENIKVTITLPNINYLELANNFNSLNASDKLIFVEKCEKTKEHIFKISPQHAYELSNFIESLKNQIS